MIFRWLGALMIMTGCGGIGFSRSLFYKKEIQSMCDFIRLLDVMESELAFRQTPLPELCKMASCYCKSYEKVFWSFSNALESQIAPNPSACMEVVLAGFSALPESGRRCLQAFGECIGLFDLKGQLLQLQALREQCGKQLMELEANKDVKLRTYRILGICAGAALAVLLV